MQVLSEHTGPRGLRELEADTVRSLLGMLQGPQIDHDMWLQDIVVEEDEDGIGITFAVGPEERPDVPIARAKQDIYARLDARPDAVIRFGLDQPPTRRIVARVADVPGFGWRRFEPAVLSHPVVASAPGQPVSLSNGLVSVEVDGDLGTFSFERSARLRPTGRRWGSG